MSITPKPVIAGMPFNWLQDQNNIVRKFGILLALGAIFMRISNLHELLSFTFGIPYVLYLFAPPAIIAALLSGGIRRLFSQTPAVFWTIFAFWLVLTIPFSSWRSGSIGFVMNFVKTELPFILVFGGILLTWRDYKYAMYTMVLATATVLATSTAFLDNSYGRAAIEFGTIGNANDLAAHLIFSLPFLYFAIVAPKVFFPIRALALVCTFGALYYILASASRGAFLSLLSLTFFILFRASAKQKLVLMVVAPVAIAVGLAMIPKSNFARIFSMFGDSVVAQIGDVSVDEAAQSKEIRMYLLKKSIEYTIRRPVFGVGPGNFASFEGLESRESGHKGSWHQTHNVYTQISSECGIPALLFYLGAMIATFRLASKTYKQAKQYKDCEDISIAAISLMMCMVGFGICITFLTIGYRFYLLGLAGFATVLYNLAQARFAQAAAAAASAAAPKSVPVGPRGMTLQPMLKKQQIPQLPRY